MLAMLFGRSIKAKGFFGIGFHLVVQLRIFGLAHAELSDPVSQAFPQFWNCLY